MEKILILVENAVEAALTILPQLIAALIVLTVMFYLGRLFGNLLLKFLKKKRSVYNPSEVFSQVGDRAFRCCWCFYRVEYPRPESGFYGVAHWGRHHSIGYWYCL